MKNTGLVFLVVGLVFLILGFTGQRNYYPIAVPFIVLGMIFLCKRRQK